MPKAVNYDTDIPKLEKVVDGLDKEVKKLGGAHKKKNAEFETLNGSLWEGKELIEESQKSLKKEKDPKKIKELAEEIEAQETTFKKISGKIPAIRKELEGMSKEAAGFVKTVKETQKEIAEMSKGLARTGGDVSEIKAWSKTLKDLDSTMETAFQNASIVADSGLPNTPKL